MLFSTLSLRRSWSAKSSTAAKMEFMVPSSLSLSVYFASWDAFSHDRLQTCMSLKRTSQFSILALNLSHEYMIFVSFTVTMGFFDDILIPPESLQQPAKLYPALMYFHDIKWRLFFSSYLKKKKKKSLAGQKPDIQFRVILQLFSNKAVLSHSCSDEAEQVWVWEYETDEGAHDLYMDQGEEIRLRVTDEVFVDTSPTGPSAAETSAPAQPGQAPTSAPTEENKEKKEAPYTLIVRTPFTFLAWLTPVNVHIYHTRGRVPRDPGPGSQFGAFVWHHCHVCTPALKFDEHRPTGGGSVQQQMEETWDSPKETPTWFPVSAYCCAAWAFNKNNCQNHLFFFFFRPRGPSVNRAWGCCHGGTINTEMCFGSERKRCQSDQQRDTRAPQPNCCRCDIVDVRAVTTTLVVFGHQTCQHLCLHIKSTVVITDTVAALNLTCAFGKFWVWMHENLFLVFFSFHCVEKDVILKTKRYSILQ